MEDKKNSQQILGADGGSRQFLSFTLANQEYAIDILKVQEIKGMSKVTPIPNSPAYINGVINLRGTVVPIMDLRCRFGMPCVEASHLTVIVIVNVASQVVGLVVDAVSDVLNILPSDIAATPEIAGGLDSSFVPGLARVEDTLVTLLNIEKLVSRDELSMANVAAA